jgi:molybdopterin synthase sulfur carrier subunit
MTATVNIQLFSSLKLYNPENSSQYPIIPGMTVAQLFSEINVPIDSVKLVFINGRRRPLATAIQGGERIGVFPAVGGG